MAILTVSDRSAVGEREDLTGPWLAEWATAQGFVVEQRAVVPDEAIQITRQLLTWVDDARMDVIISTGGTGFSPRDVTPEATLPLLQRRAPGIEQAIQQAGAQATPFAALSRVTAGVRGSTIIINLPGSPGGVKDGAAVLAPLLPHLSELLKGAAEEHPTGAEG